MRVYVWDAQSMEREREREMNCKQKKKDNKIILFDNSP